MTSKAPQTDLTGIAEFLPVKRPAAPKERRVMVGVERAEHEAITDMATLASEKTGQFVSQGDIIRALLKHYNSFE